MIEDERTAIYIESLNSGNEAYLDKIEETAKQSNVPIIRKQAQSFIKLMLANNKPLNILEIGTATGFSAIFMAEYTGASTHITTIEKYEKRIPIAKENIKAAGFEDKIELLEGDALEILKLLVAENRQYDFIFMDAAKAQYINMLPDVLALLEEGGVLITDNCLQDGDIIQPKYAVRRRDRTIHKRMRDYLYAITHEESFVTDILPIGDGLSVSIKVGKK